MSQELDKKIAAGLHLLREDEKKALLAVIKAFLNHRPKKEVERLQHVEALPN